MASESSSAVLSPPRGDFLSPRGDLPSLSRGEELLLASLGIIIRIKLRDISHGTVNLSKKLSHESHIGQQKRKI